jgi:hypothetical protein
MLHLTDNGADFASRFSKRPLSIDIAQLDCDVMIDGRLLRPWVRCISDPDSRAVLQVEFMIPSEDLCSGPAANASI